MIRVPVWLYAWLVTTSSIGVFAVLKPLGRWRDRTLAKIERRRQ